MSKVLNVSTSGFYKWRKSDSVRAEKIALLDQQILQVFEDSDSTYGSPRVFEALQKESVEVSESTIARSMNRLKITPKKRKKYKNTTDSKHDNPISPNILNRCFKATELGKVWVSDITYIPLKYGFVYLTTVLDLADRMVVGWNLSNNMTDQDTTIAALKKALKNRPIEEGLIFHSDRGSQYASVDFRKLLVQYKCIQSMSRKGNCWDNAVAESFFKTIKSEKLNRYNFASMDEVYTTVFRYIEGWYNAKRIHSSLGGMSPREMAEKLAA